MRDTVRDFYRRFKGGEDGTPAGIAEVCPAEAGLAQQLINQNAVLKLKCGSVALEPLKDALQLARESIDYLVEIIFDCFNIVMQLVLMLSATGDVIAKAGQELAFWFQQLIADSLKALEALGNLMLKMVLEISPIGMLVKLLIDNMCRIIAWLTNDVWKGFLCPVMQAILPPLINAAVAFLGFINEIVKVVNDIGCAFGKCVADADAISRSIDSANAFKRHVEGGGLNCGGERMTCNNKQDSTVEQASLPVATRCWAG